jgi:hypothetical protein
MPSARTSVIQNCKGIRFSLSIHVYKYRTHTSLNGMSCNDGVKGGEGAQNTAYMNMREDTEELRSVCSNDCTFKDYIDHIDIYVLLICSIHVVLKQTSIYGHYTKLKK